MSLDCASWKEKIWSVIFFSRLPIFNTWRFLYQMTLFSERSLAVFLEGLSLLMKESLLETQGHICDLALFNVLEFISFLSSLFSLVASKFHVCMLYYISCVTLYMLYTCLHIYVYIMRAGTTVVNHINSFNTDECAKGLLSPRKIQLTWGCTQMTFPWTGYLV